MNFLKKPKIIDINRTNNVIKKLFLSSVPDDFFKLWQFCHDLCSFNPKEALTDFNLVLVGPFDVIDNKLSESLSETDPEKALCYYRYFYDPPEMLTILKDSSSNFHIGYFRDDPNNTSFIVASNNPDKSCTLTLLGDNIFSALIQYSSTLLSKSGAVKSHYKENSKIEALKDKLKAFAIDQNVDLTNKLVEQRKKKIVAKTFHGAGIVVPFKNDIGYRPLPYTDVNLQKLLKKIIDTTTDREKCLEYKELQNLITLANIANDELDFGMSLELGIDIFCFGNEYFHKHIFFILNTCYSLLDRDQFSTILKAHLRNRRKGSNLKF